MTKSNFILLNVFTHSNKWLHPATVLFLMLFAFPLLPFHWTNVLLILFSVYTLVLYFINPFPPGRILLFNIFFILPFIPYLLEFIFTGFEPIARFQFEKKIFFFTAPLVIPLFLKICRFNNYKTALLVFSLSVVSLCVYAFSILIARGIPFTAEAYENGSFILRHQFEKLTGLHSTVYAAFALGSAVFLFMYVASKKNIRLIFRIMSVVLFLSALYLAVRIAFFTVAVIFLLLVLNSRKPALNKILISVSVLLFMTVVLFLAPSVNSRFNEFLNADNGTTDNLNTVSQRKAITSCSWQVFTEYFFTGTGSSHFQEKLNTCYMSKGWTEGAQNNFNTHNQYLASGVNYGIFILITFLLCLFIIFRKIIKLPEGKYYAVIVLMFFLTESLLEKQMGVYFFGLLSVLMYNVETVE